MPTIQLTPVQKEGIELELQMINPLVSMLWRNLPDPAGKELVHSLFNRRWPSADVFIVALFILEASEDDDAYT